MDNRDAVARPGTRRVYSNAGFDALGGHLERVTGIRTADSLHQAVCEPLGLRATELTGSPAAGARASVADLAAVAAELLRPGRLLHPSSVAQLASVQFPGLAGVVPGYGRQPANHWGLGLEIRDHKSPHWTGARNPRRRTGTSAAPARSCGGTPWPGWPAWRSPTGSSSSGPRTPGRPFRTPS